MFLATSILLLIGASAHAVDDIVPANVQRSKQCSPGSELIGKQCVATEVISPSLVCPSGTSVLNGECATYAQAQRICPNGFNPSGKDECSLTKIVPASLSCDEGELSGKSCRLVKEIPSICPPNTETKEDGSCVQYTPLQKLCPPGYRLQGKECAKRIVSEAQPICPPEFFLSEDGSCSKPVPVPGYCPTGFYLDDGICTRPIPKVPAPCPQGFLPTDGGSCKRVTESQTRPVCDEGFSLAGNGICQKSVPVYPTCPVGTARDASGTCQKKVAKVPTCEDGYYENGLCQKSTYFVPELVCSTGFTLYQGKCKKVSTQEPLERCVSGVLREGLCVVESSTSPVLSCPDGFSVTAGPKCVRQVSYDCSKTVSDTQCDMPEFVSAIAANPARRLNYKEKPIQVKAVVSKEVVEKAAGSKEARCNTVSRIIPETCSKDEERAVEYICANGSQPEGQSCRITSTSEPVKYCGVGQLDRATGKCTTLQIVEASIICRIGDLQDSGHCLKVSTSPASYICPESSSDNGSDCSRPVQEIPHPDRIVNATPTEVCDIGSRKGQICVLEEELPRSEECPASSLSNNGRCYVTASLIIPPPSSVTRQPQYLCPEGTLASGKDCSREDTVRSEYTCVTGVEENRKCAHYLSPVAQPAKVTHAAPTPVCEIGFQLQGNQCISVIRHPAELLCPRGASRYQSGSQECVRPHSKVPVCPAGSKLEGKDCIKKTFSAPTVTEIKVCTKGQPNC